MWLDEILQTEMSRGSLGELWQALRNDVVHPPLDGLVTWVVLQIGASEPLRRLVPAAFGVATVVLATRWVATAFGARVARIFAVLAITSPMHVFYSQELRPYSMALFFVVAAIACAQELWVGSGRAWLWAILFAALLGVLYSLYFAATVALPLLVLVAARAVDPDPEVARRARGRLRHLPWLVLGVGAAYLPWLPVVSGLGTRAVEKESSAWTLEALWQRIEILTVGGLEGDPASWQGILPAILLLLGGLAAWRRRDGLAVICGALGGTVGVEILLRWTDHWTSSRYDLMAWPFWTLLLALGIEKLMPRRDSARWPGRVLAAAVLLGLVALQCQGLWRLATLGRPDWATTARVVDSLTRPGDRILAANPWTRICLSHYLDRLAGETEGSTAPEVVVAEPGAEGLAWGRGEGCELLVAGGYPPATGWWGRVPARSLLHVDPGGLGTRVHRLSTYEPGKDCIWTVPAAVTRRGLLPALEFVPRDAPRLLAGWSTFETAPDGTTFVWVVGREAVLSLGGLDPAPRRIRSRLRSLSLPGISRHQQMTVDLNGEALWSGALQPGFQSLEIAVPESAWRREENLLRLRFATATSPSELQAGSGDRRRLAAAFDRLEVLSSRAARVALHPRHCSESVAVASTPLARCYRDHAEVSPDSKPSAKIRPEAGSNRAWQFRFEVMVRTPSRHSPSPPHSANCDPSAAVAISSTIEDSTKSALQVAPQSIPCGRLRTRPSPDPTSSIVSE